MQIYTDTTSIFKELYRTHIGSTSLTLSHPQGMLHVCINFRVFFLVYGNFVSSHCQCRTHAVQCIHQIHQIRAGILSEFAHGKLNRSALICHLCAA